MKVNVAVVFMHPDGAVGLSTIENVPLNEAPAASDVGLPGTFTVPVMNVPSQTLWTLGVVYERVGLTTLSVPTFFAVKSNVTTSPGPIGPTPRASG